jgi:hypothetical protein
MKKNHNFYKSINISAFIKNILILCIFYFFTFQSSFAQLNNDKLKNDKIDKDKLTEQLNNKPFTFMENKGQWPKEVLFMANTKSLRAWITKKAMVFEQFEESKNASNNPFEDTLRNKEIKTHVTGLEFVNPKQVKVQKFNPIITKYNFLIGNDESKHAKDVAAYENVKIENIYEGIDMKFYFDNGELRYDYIVKPNADPNQIELEIKGGDSFRIVNGELIIETSLNPVIKKELFAYQKDKFDNTKKNKVNSEFTLTGNKLKFNIGNYDKSQELVIDPITLVKDYIFIYKNTQGTNYYEYVYDTERDQEGQLYYCGQTYNSSFPSTYGITKKGSTDATIGMIEIDANGDFVPKWSTLFGGGGSEEGFAMELENNKIYVTGSTTSTIMGYSNDFPLTVNHYYNSLVNGRSHYFLVFDKIGIREYSTYLKNGLYQTGSPYVNGIMQPNNDIKVSPEGNVYIIGCMNTLQTPSFTEYKPITTQTRVTSTTEQSVGYIYGFEPTSNSNGLDYNVLFASKFSGDESTTISSLDIDDNNNLYIAGATKSSASSLYTTSGAYKTTNALNNSATYFTKLSLGSSNLDINYNSFFFDNIIHHSIHDLLYFDGKLAIAGYTWNNTLPLYNAFDSTFQETGTYRANEGFISVFQFISSGNDLLYSSYFGGNFTSEINDLEYDAICNKIIFTGFAGSEYYNYGGTLIETFKTAVTSSNLTLGVLDINLIGVNTLTQLGYFQYTMYQNSTCLFMPNDNKVILATNTGNT